MVPVCFADLRHEAPAVYMIRAALRHRHMSPTQKTAVGVELEKLLEGPAKVRQAEGGGDKKSKTAKSRKSRKSPGSVGGIRRTGWEGVGV